MKEKIVGFLKLPVFWILAFVIFCCVWCYDIFNSHKIFGFDYTHFKGHGEIGDFFGGVLNPFIGFFGVLLTFAAFYVQYKANRDQRKDIENQTKRNSFENQFYLMLDLHKENVNGITCKSFNSIEKEDESRLKIEREYSVIRGRQVFERYIVELKIGYDLLIDPDLKKQDTKVIFKKAYDLFFNGIIHFKRHKGTTESKINTIEAFKAAHKDDKIMAVLHESEVNNHKLSREILYHSYFDDKRNKLSLYYRHLFNILKLIDRVDESVLSYEEKRNYLRILRGQLSSSEQCMLFYNWYSDYGSSWQNEENKFFTDYRIIHNLMPEDLIKGFIEIIKETLLVNKEFRKEKGRKEDPIFEHKTLN